jgi:hypothetical protein
MGEVARESGSQLGSEAPSVAEHAAGGGRGQLPITGDLLVTKPASWVAHGMRVYYALA